MPHPTEIWSVAVEVSENSYKLWRVFDSATEPDNLTFTLSVQDKQRVKPVIDPKGLQGNISKLSS